MDYQHTDVRIDIVNGQFYWAAALPGYLYLVTKFYDWEKFPKTIHFPGKSDAIQRHQKSPIEENKNDRTPRNHVLFKNPALYDVTTI